MKVWMQRVIRSNWNAIERNKNEKKKSLRRYKVTKKATIADIVSHVWQLQLHKYILTLHNRNLTFDVITCEHGIRRIQSPTGSYIFLLLFSHRFSKCVCTKRRLSLQKTTIRLRNICVNLSSHIESLPVETNYILL